MIAPLRHFDENEWTVLGFLVLTALFAMRLRKRIPLTLSLLMILFSITVSRVFDHFLAGPGLPDLYDIMDRNKIEWFDLLNYVMYAPSAYLFIYFYERWELKGLLVPGYILAWSAVATGIEWVMHLAHVFTYKEWSIGYSFCVYLFVQPLTLWVYRYLKSRYDIA